MAWKSDQGLKYFDTKTLGYIHRFTLFPPVAEVGKFSISYKFNNCHSFVHDDKIIMTKIQKHTISAILLTNRSKQIGPSGRCEQNSVLHALVSKQNLARPYICFSPRPSMHCLRHKVHTHILPRLQTQNVPSKPKIYQVPYTKIYPPKHSIQTQNVTSKPKIYPPSPKHSFQTQNVSSKHEIYLASLKYNIQTQISPPKPEIYLSTPKCNF